MWPSSRNDGALFQFRSLARDRRARPTRHPVPGDLATCHWRTGGPIKLASDTAIDIAIPRGSTRPALQAPARIHQFDPRTFGLGRDELEVGARRPLGLYSAERSLIDVVRLRHLEGSDVAWEALRRWLGRPGRSPGQLIELAQEFARAEPALRRALEVLL